jgi:FkbM family methyltransferase
MMRSTEFTLTKQMMGQGSHPFMSRGLLTHRLHVLRSALLNLGLHASLVWLGIRLGRMLHLPSCRTWIVKPRNASFPLIVRLQGSSDVLVLGQIFIDDEYAPLQYISSPRFIVDLGANVGFASAYFLSCFSSAKLLAVEPDPSNVAACRRNLEPFGDRAKVIQGAAWSECTALRFASPPRRGHEWGNRVVKAADATARAVQAWDLPTLIENAGVDSIDLLKIDIEGAEAEVFSRGPLEWLRKVRNLCIELHDADCELAFFTALSGYKYDLSHSGELVILRNLSPIC